jgi:hypothetical protein
MIGGAYFGQIYFAGIPLYTIANPFGDVILVVVQEDDRLVTILASSRVVGIVKDTVVLVDDAREDA